MNAIMSDFEFKQGAEPAPQNWEGLTELDRALAENRLTEYRMKKAWADPWARYFTIGVLLIILVGFIYLFGAITRRW